MSYIIGKGSFDVEKTAIDLVMNDNVPKKRQLAKKIFDVAYEEEVYPSSIHELYMARGRGESGGFTVPAINLRSISYDLARAIFRVAKKMILALSSLRLPSLRSVTPISRRLNSKHRSSSRDEGKLFRPVFIQGDHFQVNAAKFKENPDKEIEGLQALIRDAVYSGFYNIDIDSSTLVDVTKLFERTATS